MGLFSFVGKAIGAVGKVVSSVASAPFKIAAGVANSIFGGDQPQGPQGPGPQGPSIFGCGPRPMGPPPFGHHHHGPGMPPPPPGQGGIHFHFGA